MLLLRGVLLPCLFQFCTLILNRSGFLNPFSLILQLLLQFDPFFVDAFEMAVRPFNPVIQKSGHARIRGINTIQILGDPFLEGGIQANPFCGSFTVLGKPETKLAMERDSVSVG